MRHLVAARRRVDAEPLLDHGEVLVELAEQRRHQPVVVEGDDDMGRAPSASAAAVPRSRRTGAQAAASAMAAAVSRPRAASAPNRLLVPTAGDRRRGAIVPISAGVAIDLDRRQPGRAADDLARLRGRVRSNSTSAVRADPRRVEGAPGCALIAACSRAEPLGLHRLRHLIVSGRRRRAGPRAVLEREGRGVADLVDDATACRRNPPRSRRGSRR